MFPSGRKADLAEYISLSGILLSRIKKVVFLTGSETPSYGCQELRQVLLNACYVAMGVQDAKISCQDSHVVDATFLLFFFPFPFLFFLHITGWLSASTHLSSRLCQRLGK